MMRNNSGSTPRSLSRRRIADKSFHSKSAAGVYRECLSSESPFRHLFNESNAAHISIHLVFRNENYLVQVMRGQKSPRPWRVIAEELNHAIDRAEVRELSRELNAVLIGRQSSTKPREDDGPDGTGAKCGGSSN